MNPTYYTVAGLVLDLVGAIFMVRGLVVTDQQAVDAGVARWGDVDDDKNKQQPLVQSFIRNSRDAKAGAGLLALGFLLQIIGAVLE